jgi:hypothetical protein
MAWPGPRRRAVPLRLSEAEERPVRELAETLPYVNGKPNVSAAIRQIIAEWDAGKGRTSLPTDCQ